MAINYALAKRESPKVKARLTRAIKTGKYKEVLAACYTALACWASWGAWPDDWHRWQIALDDAAHKHNMALGWGADNFIRAPRLEDLSA